MPEVHKDGTLVKFYNSENKMGPHGVAVVQSWSWHFKFYHFTSYHLVKWYEQSLDDFKHC